MLWREGIRPLRVLIIAAVLVMLQVCPRAAGLTRTLNMEPPSGVLSSNPSNTPRRYNLNQGANFNISCTATHDDCSFTVDLYKDGTILRTGVIMDTELIKPRRSPCTMAEVYLVFQNFQPVHDGVYYCSASTNDRSQVLSDEWYLYGSETPPPTPVRVTPKHNVFYDDENLELEAKFRGNFFENYWSWFGTDGSTTTGETLMEPDVNITNVGQTYSIAAGTMYHRKGYYGPVFLPTPTSSIMATAENTVVVNEHMPPTVSFIGLQPSYQEGSMVTLTCTASGFPEVNIEFEVYGVAAVATKQTQTQASLYPPFTVTRTLMLDKVTTLDCGGRISCVGTNQNRVAMHATSVHTVVQIRAPPLVTRDPPTPAATVGSPLTLKCFANDCMQDEFTFIWRFNGQQVDSSLVMSISSNASQLTVDSVATADFGTYTCLVTNTVGTTTGTFTVMEADMSSIVQVHLNTPTSCPTWVEINGEQKLNDVKSSITMRLEARCDCTFQVLSSQFSCIDDTTVVYQADLHYGLPSDSTKPNAVGVLSAWVMENPRIAISSEELLLQVNPSCRVQVTSIADTSCFPTTLDTSLSVGSIIGIVIGVILGIAVALILVGSLIALALCYRKKVNDYAHLAAQRHQRTRAAMQGNFEMRRSIDMQPKPDAESYKLKQTSDTTKLVEAPEAQMQGTCDSLPAEAQE